jgi:hypothetical protein
MDVIFLLAYASAGICLSSRCLVMGVYDTIRNFSPSHIEPRFSGRPALGLYTTLIDSRWLQQPAFKSLAYESKFCNQRVLEMITRVAQLLINGASKRAQYLKTKRE